MTEKFTVAEKLAFKREWTKTIKLLKRSYADLSSIKLVSEVGEKEV